MAGGDNCMGEGHDDPDPSSPDLLIAVLFVICCIALVLKILGS